MSHQPDPVSGGPSQRLAEEVLSYLERRPNSMDTLDGIASFWLKAAGAADREHLVHAIEALVASGALERVRTAGIAKYRLPR